MKKILFLGIICFFLFSCAKKEVPPVVEVPSSAIEKPEEIKKPEKVEKLPKEKKEIVSNATEEVFKPEEIPPQKEDKEYWKLYGRGSAPLYAIFFDFDEYTIRDDMWDRIKQNVKYLLEHKDVKVELQGNCDERGTNEYNMALGAKRALEVKKVLIKLGIDEERINTISFGEEKPLCKESNEECWALNRRVDFVIIK
ncbi:MAG: peptidoglycan-associated lipoprotein [Thermodesulfobacterium geofontis]|uniref:Peptidoglycan-associated lipoprotein n=1 Tax=Thermodesulfobacterium geofontis TaxID=1295609 RepID=A0A2N7PQ53_9BACT|nr:MAG: peptidoglycan-associated lipoprotein [Thermodesulfobacterium geofontis]PMP97393.1 MAG: peptidoglycan-associated lipoprotein [Thermodesulfobacterium geofontis]